MPIFEYLVFRTKHFWHFLQYRSGGIWDVLTHRDGYAVVNGPGKLLNDLNWAAAFTDADLWLGVLAAAALLYAAARIRRYRDDT